MRDSLVILSQTYSHEQQWLKINKNVNLPIITLNTVYFFPLYKKVSSDLPACVFYFGNKSYLD